MAPLSRRFRSIGLLSTALAVIVVAATAGAQAQMRPSTMNMGPRGGMSMGGGSIGNLRTTEPRFQRFPNSVADDDVIQPRKRPRVVIVTEGDGRPGRRPPHKRPRGPVIGPVIGTGVAVINPGPAGATMLTPRGGIYLPPNEPRYVKDEVLLEFRGQVALQVSGPIATRNRLRAVESIYLPLTNTTVSRLKITDGSPVPTVLNRLRREARVDFFAQPNFFFRTSQAQAADATEAQDGKAQDAKAQDAKAQDSAKPEGSAKTETGASFTLQAAQQPEGKTESKPEPTPAAAAAATLPRAGDPAQYALAKLHLGEAHSLATGDKILVAVIDSGVDLGHPDLASRVAGSFDALDKAEKPHAHGTAIAALIAGHGKLLGAAVTFLSVPGRAFDPKGGSAQGTTFAIIKGLDWAVAQHARVINMSFAGPADPMIHRALEAANKKGVVLIAAAGNAGPKSPPLYPAAEPSVIAVTATDASDNLFKGSNRGRHIAVAAPGVDVLIAVPNGGYEISTGTSYSSAEVSGIAALMLQRKPDLTPATVREVLLKTAKDLGKKGRDDDFGAGLADAYRAVTELPGALVSDALSPK